MKQFTMKNKFYGIQFDVNDALSVSYNLDESEQNTRSAVAVGASAGTKAVVAMEQETLQLAYTLVVLQLVLLTSKLTMQTTHKVKNSINYFISNFISNLITE